MPSGRVTVGVTVYAPPGFSAPAWAKVPRGMSSASPRVELIERTARSDQPLTGVASDPTFVTIKVNDVDCPLWRPLAVGGVTAVACRFGKLTLPVGTIWMSSTYWLSRPAV